MALLAAGGYGYTAFATTTPNVHLGCLKAGQIYGLTIQGQGTPTTCVKPAIQINRNQTGPAGTNGTNGPDGTNVLRGWGFGGQEGEYQ